MISNKNNADLALSKKLNHVGTGKPSGKLDIVEKYCKPAITSHSE